MAASRATKPALKRSFWCGLDILHDNLLFIKAFCYKYIIPDFIQMDKQRAAVVFYGMLVGTAQRPRAARRQR